MTSYLKKVAAHGGQCEAEGHLSHQYQYDRALIRCLSWCSRVAIPQGTGDASILVGKVTSLTWDDVKEANRTLQKLKETVVPLQVLKMDKKKSLLVFADASLSNLADGRTQVSMVMGWVNTQTFR